MHFRVATYNVHKCKGLDWRVSPGRIADVISTIDADVLATQEILLSQAEEISQHIALPFTFGPARVQAGEPYGNAVFTRFPVASWENHDITVRRREPRRCLRLTLQLPNESELHFFAVHLGTSFWERREQARQLLSPRILQSTRHRILAGDFNEWTRGLATRLLSDELQSTDINFHLKRRTTYPGALPFMHLDHIYYDCVFKLQKLHLHRSKLSLLASDHLPLSALFGLGLTNSSQPLNI
jgi:endonuclease/exonuclease/phosphatase family metal-dependent hydrolase